jgi:DNA modification methylase
LNKIDYIHLGDGDRIMAGMPNQSVDLILTDPDYRAQIPLDQMMRICRGSIICFSDPDREFFKPDERAYWIKTPSTKNYSKHLGRFVEAILIKRQGSPQTFNSNLHWSNYTGVYTDMIQDKIGHPYQKPFSLMERLILIYSKPGDVVFDPYAGSGTTILAAEIHGRKGRGVEINNGWHKLAEERLERSL